jgi:elongation factor P hydroxylase
MIRKLDPEKLAKLHKVDDLLDERYGKRGTPAREAMRERALNRYYSTEHLQPISRATC